VGPNPFIGVIYHWIGSFASATSFIPFRGIKRWSWEIYWLIQGFAAWIVAPPILAGLLVPNLFGILHAAPSSSIHYALLWGALWGVGGLTFGLAIRYLGIALGYAIALGLCTIFGTLIPPIYDGSIHTILHETSGRVILAGVLLCLIAVAVNAAAGLSKESEVTPEEKAEAGESDFSFGKGLAVAIVAGIMSSFFAFGLKAGAPIGALAKTELLAHNKPDLWQNLPVLIVVLWGAFLTNFIWSAILILKNGSIKQFTGEPGNNPMRATHATGHTLMDLDTRLFSPGRLLPERLAPRILAANYLFAALAGVIWYLQFVFYSMGHANMDHARMGQASIGNYAFSSWPLHTAGIILFAALWGLALKEWRGTSRRTKILVATGLFLLVSSTIVIGYGNSLNATQPTTNIDTTN
jgi:L-rhamnose-H+ transport protein